MRVLFLTREYPPFEVGGVAQHVASLRRELARLGISSRVLSFGDPACSGDGVTFLAPVSSILSKSPLSLRLDAGIPSDILRFTDAAQALLRAEAFDVVHVEEPYLGALVRHPHKVTTIHDTSVGELRSILHRPAGVPDAKRALFFGTLGPSLEWTCARTSERIIVPSDHIRKELTSFYRIPERKIRVIRNGVNVPVAVSRSTKAEGKDRLGLPEVPLVFTAAQHVARKRLETLLDAVHLLRRRGVTGFHTVVAGEGPATPWLIRRAERHGLGGALAFAGWLPREKLEDYYAAADIFVLTSDYEAGPISLLEAMSHGAAVVSTRIEGFPALLRDGVDGLLFPPGDAAALADRLQSLLSDSALRDRLSEAAVAFARAFDWATVARETADLYGSLV